MDISKAVTRVNDFIGKIVEVIDPESPSGTKVGLIEYPTLVFAASNLIPIFADLKELADSVKNISDEQKAALIAQFAKEFDIPNDAAEAKVERTFQWIVETADFAFDISRKDTAA